MKWSDFMKINVIARSDRKDKQYNATGIYNGKCLVVKKGSVVSKKINNGVPKSITEMRKDDKLLRNNTLIIDIEFSNPSRAATFVTGSVSNGYRVWKEIETSISLRSLNDYTRGNAYE